MADAFLPEFDHEMATTRRTLERVSEDQLTWKPHEKSMPLGRLAGHIAELSSLAALAMNTDSFDFGTGGAKPLNPATSQELLDAFDRNSKDARAAIAAASDEHLMKPWTLALNGKTMFTMPRIAVIRTLLMNHVIHHRGQLSVYLRMTGAAVPSIYGPSADEAA